MLVVDHLIPPKLTTVDQGAVLGPSPYTLRTPGPRNHKPSTGGGSGIPSLTGAKVGPQLTLGH